MMKQQKERQRESEKLIIISFMIRYPKVLPTQVKEDYYHSLCVCLFKHVYKASGARQSFPAGDWARPYLALSQLYRNRRLPWIY